MATTAANESWKPASKSVYGFQASRTKAPTRRNHQRSRSRASSHAMEPSAPAMRADGEDVRGDRGQRGELANEPRDSGQPGCHQCAAGDERDVLSRDGEEVV